MATSSRERRLERPGGRLACAGRALVALGLLGACLTGCAHAPGVPAPQAAPHHTNGQARPRESPPPAAKPVESRGSPPSPLDPTEEITPEELASIPDPVPGGAGSTTPATPPANRDPEAPGTSESPQGDPRELSQESPEGRAGPAGRVWRVQIAATADLQLAGRVARDAQGRLGVRAGIEFEGGLYKVRLGAFNSEADAQSLREQAVRGGYPGAFRVRCAADSTASKE